MTKSYWSAKSVLERQGNEPVFLTNGCTENNLDNTPTTGFEVFEPLGLKFGWTDEHNNVYDAPGGRGDVPDHGRFYPLTPDENKFVGEDSADGPYGGAMLGYAMLYRGKKYIGPNVEVCFKGNRQPFSDESYGIERVDDALYPDGETALAEAYRLANFLRPKLQAIGGDVVVIDENEVDRHAVAILVPTEFAVFSFPGEPPIALKAFKRWVESLFGGYRSTPSPLFR